MKKHIYLIFLIAGLLSMSCSDDPAKDYSIIIKGYRDAAPVSFTCHYQDLDAQVEGDISIAGIDTLFLAEEGRYILQPELSGATSFPLCDTVNLTSSDQTAEAFFIFSTAIDTTDTSDADTTSTDTTASITQFFFQNEGDPYTLIVNGPDGVDTVEVAEGGSFWDTEAGTGDIIIIHPEREGYCAEPESLVLLVDRDDGAYAYEFEFYEQEYYLIVDGNFTGLPIEFDLLISSETEESLVVVSEAGLALELPHSGEYLLYPAHISLMPESTVYHIDIVGCRDSAIVNVNFIDTVEYSLTLNITGDMDGEPFDFQAAYRRGIPGSGWDTVLVEDGEIDIAIESSGYYIVRAWKFPFLAVPEEDMVYLDGDSPEANAHFTFIDTTTPPKKIFVHGLLHGDPTSFDLRYMGDWESEWTEISVPTEGETLRVYPDGELTLIPEKDGFVAMPEMTTLEVEGEGTDYDVSFSFGDSLGYLEEIGIYVADWYNYRVCRFNNIVTGEGWATVGPLSDYGTIDGPSGVAVSRFGEIYITDRGYSRLIKLDTFRDDSPYETFSSSDIYRPERVRLDNEGRIYVISGYGNSVVRIDNIDGDGYIAYTEDLNHPDDVAFDDEGRIHITDRFNHRIIRMDDMTGTGRIEYGSYGSGMDNFNAPVGITIDDENRIYVSDIGNGRVVRIDNMDGDGWETLTTTSVGPVDAPSGICFAKGGIYIANYDHVFRVINFDGDRAIRFGEYGSGFGQFNHLKGVYVIDAIFDLDSEVKVPGHLVSDRE